MKHPYSTDMDPAGMVLSTKVGEIGQPLSHTVFAKIDTGADMTALPEELLGQLGVTPRGCVYVRGAFDKEPKERPTFFVTLQVDSSPPIDVEVLGRSKQTGLLGRDVLNDFVLLADGPGKHFQLSQDHSQL